MDSANQSTFDSDILQEVMNIAFGAAAAELSELIDIFVRMEVPVIKILELDNLKTDSFYTVFGRGRYSVVKQDYWGDFQGSALLVFPEGRGTDLITILNGAPPGDDTQVSISNVEDGVLLELGNILIGACVAKICELLKTVVSFRPPTVKSGIGTDGSIFDSLGDSSQYAIVMKTTFEFSERNVEGSIVIVTSDVSMSWLDKALHGFLESF